MDKIIIIGGGVIGLSTGWQLLRKGFDVEIIERGEAGKSAGWASAGMLAPEAELGFEEIELFRLCKKSFDLYPEFIEELEEDSGIHVHIDKSGSLMVGLDRDDNERLRRIYVFREEVKMPVTWLTGSEARELEPLLSPKCSGAIWIAEDAQVDNREMLNALKIAIINKGGKITEYTKVDSVIIENNKIKGVNTEKGIVYGDGAIVSAGAWSKQINGIPEELKPPVRPVKGQIISLKMDENYKLQHMVRAPDVYILPKHDGRIILGASSEEMGFDINPTAGEIYKLLERGWEAMPSIYDLPIISIDVGLRPGSRDHEPIIGGCGIDGLFFATGHFRHGILLTPVTAYELSGQISTGIESKTLENFQLSRFFKEQKI
ncbi:MAG: glycine oxidase ThiO [Ignavibacteriae bacterium]|nr:MAG: glycine oxidase ThiO [Ignavibacteriota bacterium]